MKMAVYRFIRFWVKLAVPKYKVDGVENLPDKPCIVVANHAQMMGPISSILYYPRKRSVWCIGEMKKMSEVPAYAFKDFWSLKPKYSRWFYKILSYVIAPIADCIFNSADTIGVYKDARLVQTFRDSVDALKNGKDIILFPECHDECNNIVYEFQTGFSEVARLYYRYEKKAVSFVPMYVAPNLAKLCLGKPIQYDPENPAKDERLRISDYLKNEITQIARNLPEHYVVPYENLPKSEYPKNTDYDKTGQR